MLFFIFCLTFAITTIATKTTTNSSNWAVLVAGSNGYYNYRHQADIAHAYKILTKIGGFPDENIIVMMYNDVVNSSQNPIPGKLFNEPGGVDVYGDIVIDYVGDQVTAKNFLNVLKGIETKSGLPVLKSKKNDNVFIYYSDHGATGLVAMPSGPPLYSNDLINALKYMYNNSMYNELVFYLEACESGSMFNQILPNNISIFATTAANPSESSYAYYYNSTLGTYMADEYSIRWMQDSTNNWNDWESLIQQFQNVKKIVTESHPQQYGDNNFENEPIEDFEAYQDRIKPNNTLLKLLDSTKKDKNQSISCPSSFNPNWQPSKIGVDSRDVKLAILQNRYLNSLLLENKILYKELIEEELRYRLKIDLIFEKIIITVTGITDDEFIDALKYGHLVPTNYNCLKRAYAEYEEECDKFTDYSLKYITTLVNLCEIYGIDIILESLSGVCSS